MRRAGTKLIPALLLGLMAALPAGTAHGLATLWIYPSENCPGTLQDCIDNVAQPGDTIQIETDDIIDEFAVVTKSLTLQAGQGFHPIVSKGGQVKANSGTIAVTISGITFGNSLQVELLGGSGHSVSLDHVKVRQGSLDDEDLPIDAEVAGSVSVTRSTFEGPARNDRIGMDADQSSGLVTSRMVGNRVTGHGDAMSGGGISLLLRGSGSTRADIDNNSVWDVARNGVGINSGLAVFASSTGSGDVNVVGNSFDLSATNGLTLRSELAQGGHLALDVFDNVFSNEADFGIRLDEVQPSMDTIRLGHNDFFHNPVGNLLSGISPGTGNLNRNPMYVNETSGNLALKAASPLIDRGATCSPGGVENLDAAGHGRLAGPSVDMGAYERGATAPTGRAFVGGATADTLTGTAGADILCGYGGADVLHGAGGGDYLDGGGGNDQLFGDAGADILRGGRGDDLVVGGTGSDGLFGGPAADCLNSKDGVPGNDRLDGGPGTDRFHADPGDHLIRVEQAVASCHPIASGRP